jgi:hypothetical protein
MGQLTSTTLRSRLDRATNCPSPCQRWSATVIILLPAALFAPASTTIHTAVFAAAFNLPQQSSFATIGHSVAA